MAKEIKTLLVTGASGMIGSVIAKSGALQGYHVCVHYNKGGENALRIVAEIEAAGGHAFASAADLTSNSEVSILFSELDSRWERLDAVVNNAGLSGPPLGIAGQTADKFESAMAVNFYGAVFVTQHAIERMKTQKNGGAIVNISTKAVGSGGYRISPYVAAKGALEAFSTAIMPEIAEMNIRINTVRPGLVVTQEMEDQDSRFLAKFDSIPLKRIGRPEDVADAVLWLLSDEAGYITGSVMPLSGGQ